MLTKNLSANDITAIRRMSDEWKYSLLSRDFDGLAQKYAQDATFMPPNEPAIHGRSAIRAWMANFPRVTDFDVTNVEVDGRDDLAYVWGTYALKFQPEGEPNPIEDAGKFLGIFKKQPDGSWLLAVDIFNSNKATKY